MLRLLISLVLCAWAAAARAQNDDFDRNESYESAVQTGLEEYSAGHYEEARQLFLTAHRIQPNARTLRGLGMTEYELRRYPEAETYFEEALASETKPLTGELRKRTEELLRRTRSFVGSVRPLVRPSNAALEVDGAPAELSEELRLGVGRHVLRFQAEGRKPEARTIEVIGGQNEVLTVELAPNVGGIAETDDSTREHRDDDNLMLKRRRRWIWATLGVAVVAGTATAIALALRPSPRARDEGDLHFIPQVLGTRL